MKGQAPAVTAVLITSVIVGSVATAYVWGTPIIEKRQSQVELNKVGDKAENLYTKILSVKDGGTAIVELDSENNQLEIEINEEKDYIDISTTSNNPPYPVGTWTLVNGKNLQNLSIGSGSYAIKGQDQSGVVAVKPVGSPGSSLVTYRIEFRNMLADKPSGNRLERIDLNVEGQDRATGTSTLVLTNDGTELDSGEDRVRISGGELMDRQRTVINVKIR